MDSTKVSGNFQASNNNKGGVAGNADVANDLSSEGMNNANFATPPDGQSGTMNMCTNLT
jgi:extracellular elastinolytic metalloproteinase